MAYVYEYVFARKANFPSTSWWLVGVEMTVVLDNIWFVWRCDDHSDWWYFVCLKLQWPLWWMISDSSDIAMTIVIVWPSWLFAQENLSEECNLMGSCLQQSDVPIGLSLSFGLQGSANIFFWRTFLIERPILTLDHIFDDEQYLTWWSNVTMHYALFICSIKYVLGYWGYFWCNCDILYYIS